MSIYWENFNDDSQREILCRIIMKKNFLKNGESRLNGIICGYRGFTQFWNESLLWKIFSLIIYEMNALFHKRNHVIRKFVDNNLYDINHSWKCYWIWLINSSFFSFFLRRNVKENNFVLQNTKKNFKEYFINNLSQGGFKKFYTDTRS